MTEDTTPKRKVRRSPRGTSVTVWLRGHTKPIIFDCDKRSQEPGFLVFYSQRKIGRIHSHRIAMAEIALLEVEEPFEVGNQATSPPMLQSAVQQAPVAQGPVFSTNPLIQKRQLRSAVIDGMPASELEDGTVVPVGFIS